MKSFIASVLLLASAVIAAPALRKRDANITNIDGTILNYALTLEHLEATFYAQGLKNFTEADFKAAGFNDTMFYQNLKQIAADEATHVQFLTTALNATGVAPVAACTYDFGNLTAASFISTAVVLEGVGVSAYLGAAADITNKDYLTAAGSILTVEARHNAFVRQSTKLSPFPQPFDTPLDFDQVYSLAAPFIVSCPSTNAALPVKAFPAFTATGAFAENSTATFTVAKNTTIPSGQLYVAFPLVTGPVFEPATRNGSDFHAKIPAGAAGPAGQSYAILTSSSNNLTDDNTVAGPAVVQILPPYSA